MNKILSFSTILFFICAIYGNSYAQVNLNAPSSFLGFGELQPANHSFVEYSGGLSASFYASDQLNFANPSSFSALRTAVFEGGIHAARRNINDGTNMGSNWSGYLSYLSIGIPLQNQINSLFDRQDTKVKWGLGLELKPYSNVGFDFNQSTEIGDFPVDQSFTGDGNTYILRLANGWSYENFKLGFDVGYHFGHVDYTTEVDFFGTSPQDPLNFNTVDLNSTTYRGLNLSLGASYDIVFDYGQTAAGQKKVPNKYLTLGVIYQPETKLRSINDQVLTRENIRLGSAQNPITDTLTSFFNQRGQVTLPGSIDFGINYVHKTEWSAGMNLHLAPWSNYKNDARVETENLQDALLISAGFSWTPDKTSIARFRDRVTYSLGIHYEQDPRTLNDEQLEDMGIKLGFLLPFYSQRQVSYLNLGFGVGKLEGAGGYKENYFSLSLGYSLTDNQWFLKRKYD